MSQHGHPLVVNLEQILPLLAKEIYSTPMAFLRENLQNAFDAVRIQRYREEMEGRSPSAHRISIELNETQAEISDTGNGMTPAHMKEFYWSLGRSAKNTPEAVAAGVVGTFGIGAMANFGVAQDLRLVSRVDDDTPGTVSTASRDKLSTTEDCVFYSELEERGPRGTTVVAQLTEVLSATDARSYIQPIVRYVDFPIRLNGDIISQEVSPWANLESHHLDHDHRLPFRGTAGNVTIACEISANRNGRPTVTTHEIKIEEEVMTFLGVLRPGGEALTAYRSGFKLADVGVSSIYGLGGHVDCSALKPTAGRDTLDADSKALIQRVIEVAERGISELLSSTTALADSNAALFRYVQTHGLYEVLSNVSVRTYGSEDRTTLGQIRSTSGSQEVFYSRGGDNSIMEVFTKQGKLVVLLSSDSQRRGCEETFLQRFCSAKLLDADVIATREVPESELSETQLGFLYGVQAVLRVRYLVDGATVRPVELTRGAAVWVPPRQTADALIIWIDMRHPHVGRVVDLKGRRGYTALVDLFVRDYIFPLVKTALPSMTSDGFDLLLQRLQSNKEIMVLDLDDIKLMEDLRAKHEDAPSVVQRVSLGSPIVASEMSITTTDVADASAIERRAAEQGVQVADAPQMPESSMPGEVQSTRHILAQIEIPEKILDYRSLENVLAPWISGWYIGLTLDAFSYYKDILERLPSISFVWGGYRGSFVFFEREEGVLYYDAEFSALLRPATEGIGETGSIELTRDPLFTKSNIFLPIPEEFVDFFVPKHKAIRLIFSHEMLTPETQAALTG